MLCKHCQVAYRDFKQTVHLESDEYVERSICYSLCPECDRININYVEQHTSDYGNEPEVVTDIQIYPVQMESRKLNYEIPSIYYEDIREACMIIELSPKSSAALCRRCLQAIIRNEFGIDHGNLGKEIDTVIQKGLFPKQILDCLDALRKLGNYASHPEFNTHTGEIITVTKEEAEWTLDVIELIFNTYFAFKKKSQEIIESINKKKNQPVSS